MNDSLVFFRMLIYERENLINFTKLMKMIKNGF